MKKNNPSNSQKTQEKVVVPESGKSNTIFIRIALTILIFFVYGQTVNFEYTLDDDIFYQKHSSVQKGIEGVGELFNHGSMEKFDGTTGLQPYRPITLLSFAIEKQVFDNNPSKSHLLNVLLYILVIQVLFSILLKLFSEVHVYLLTAIMLLFALHPIHTEVVASVKSRDELLAALFGFLSWTYFIPAFNQMKLNAKQLILGSVFFTLALLSKESAIAFLVILPLSLIMLSNIKIKESLIYSIPLMVLTGLFLFVRNVIVGTESAHRGIGILDNALNGAVGFAQVTATKFEILFYYLKLLFVPWPLSWDYSLNHIPIVDWTSALPWLGLVFYGFIFILSILWFKKNPVVSFSILFFLVASSPTNNFFINNGATVAERFLFVPSFAFALAFVYLLSSFTKIELKTFEGKQKNTFIGVTALIMISFFVMDYIRIPDWKNNNSLFEAGVEVAPNSSRTNQAYATECVNQAKLSVSADERNELMQKAIGYFNKSLEIMPGNADASYKLAQVYEMVGIPDSAISNYKKSIQAKPTYYVAFNNLGAIYAGQKKYDSAQTCFEKAYKLDTTQSLSIANLMVVYINTGQFDKVIYYGEKANQMGIDEPKIKDLLLKAREMKSQK